MGLVKSGNDERSDFLNQQSQLQAIQEPIKHVVLTISNINRNCLPSSADEKMLTSNTCYLRVQSTLQLVSQAVVLLGAAGKHSLR